MSSGKWKKYEAPTDMLTAEKNTNTMGLSQEQKMFLLTNSIDANFDTATTPEEKQAWANLKVKYKSKAMMDNIGNAFVEDFWLWLQGRSPYNVVTRENTIPVFGAFGLLAGRRTVVKEYTPWGNKPLLHLPDADEFLMSPVGNRIKVIDELTKLKLRLPRNIDEAWIYYKYIVRKCGVDGSTIKESAFAHDYDFREERPLKVPDDPGDAGLVPDMAYTPLTPDNPRPPPHNEEVYRRAYAYCYNTAKVAIDPEETTESPEYKMLSPEDKVYILAILRASKLHGPARRAAEEALYFRYLEAIARAGRIDDIFGPGGLFGPGAPPPPPGGAPGGGGPHPPGGGGPPPPPPGGLPPAPPHPPGGGGPHPPGGAPPPHPPGGAPPPGGGGAPPPGGGGVPPGGPPLVPVVGGGLPPAVSPPASPRRGKAKSPPPGKRIIIPAKKRFSLKGLVGSDSDDSDFTPESSSSDEEDDTGSFTFSPTKDLEIMSYIYDKEKGLLPKVREFVRERIPAPTKAPTKAKDILDLTKKRRMDAEAESRRKRAATPAKDLVEIAAVGKGLSKRYKAQDYFDVYVDYMKSSIMSSKLDLPLPVNARAARAYALFQFDRYRQHMDDVIIRLKDAGSAQPVLDALKDRRNHPRVFFMEEAKDFTNMNDSIIIDGLTQLSNLGMLPVHDAVQLFMAIRDLHRFGIGRDFRSKEKVFENREEYRRFDAAIRHVYDALYEIMVQDGFQRKLTEMSTPERIGTINAFNRFIKIADVFYAHNGKFKDADEEYAFYDIMHMLFISADDGLNSDYGTDQGNEAIRRHGFIMNQIRAVYGRAVLHEYPEFIQHAAHAVEQLFVQGFHDVDALMLVLPGATEEQRAIAAFLDEQYRTAMDFAANTLGYAKDDFLQFVMDEVAGHVKYGDFSAALATDTYLSTKFILSEKIVPTKEMLLAEIEKLKPLIGLDNNEKVPMLPPIEEVEHVPDVGEIPKPASDVADKADKSDKAQDVETGVELMRYSPGTGTNNFLYDTAKAAGVLTAAVAYGTGSIVSGGIQKVMGYFSPNTSPKPPTPQQIHLAKTVLNTPSPVRQSPISPATMEKFMTTPPSQMIKYHGDTNSPEESPPVPINARKNNQLRLGSAIKTIQKPPISVDLTPKKYTQLNRSFTDRIGKFLSFTPSPQKMEAPAQSPNSVNTAVNRALKIMSKMLQDRPYGEY